MATKPYRSKLCDSKLPLKFLQFVAVFKKKPQISRIDCPKSDSENPGSVVAKSVARDFAELVPNVAKNRVSVAAWSATNPANPLKLPRYFRSTVWPSVRRDLSGGPGRTRTCNQTVMSGRL